MLPKYWRLRAHNNTDQIVTYSLGGRVVCKMNGWRLVSGTLSYTDITDSILSSGHTIPVGSSEEGTVQDNTSNLLWGVEGNFVVTADQTSTDGTMYLYWEGSPDNTVWPSDQADFLASVPSNHMRMVAALPLSTASTEDGASINFSF